MFNLALNWRQPRDPLVLDLDGDGIEATAIDPNAPILFDHNADGSRTATGWIKADDGLVVLDRNGNGTIDTGRELFGDNTFLADGVTLAANGFAAIAQYDANADHKINSLDAIYTQLRIWQDANQDGVSQSGELKTLTELGITSINVTGSQSNISLGNGNTQPWSGSFTRVDGSTGDSGTPELSGSLLLASNNFVREFTDDPALTAEAQALPQMHGSGEVRDLRPAMSLGTAQATALQAAVAQFAQGTTREAQRADLDALIQSWGATSAMQTSIQTNRTPISSYSTVTAIEQFAQSHPADYARITELEQFNGIDILAHWVVSVSSGGWVGNPPHWQVVSSSYVSYSAQQGSFIQQAYEALRESVYEALVLQTRLKPYLDSIGLVIDESGLRFDTSAMEALLQGAAPAKALGDVADLLRCAGDVVQAVGYTAKAVQALGDWGAGASDAQLQGLEISRGSHAGTAATEIMLGTAGADVINAGGGNDVLIGGGGADSLRGQDGNDLVDGGAGDDVLDGGMGRNTYLFGRGDGHDEVARVADGSPDKVNVLQFKDGVAPQDVVLSQEHLGFAWGTSDALVLSIRDTGDTIALNGFFNGDDPSGANNPVQLVRFGNGTTWDIQDLLARLFAGTEGADRLRGTLGADTLSGGMGSDTLGGAAGDDLMDGGDDADLLSGDDGSDVLHGGLGSDTLNGGSGPDVLLGEAGNDVLNGGDGDDLLTGGAGNDALTGGTGDNTYLFGRGDGQDVLTPFTRDGYYGGGRGVNTVQLGEGIVPSDLVLRQKAVNVNGFSGQALEISIAGTADSLAAIAFFERDDPFSESNPFQQVRFADGTVWDVAQILGHLYAGTSGADSLRGTLYDDTISGGAGNDRLDGRSGSDHLLGGDGDDWLWGGDGDNYLDGGAGNDSLTGEIGNDTLDGGAGNDSLEARGGNDIYRWGRGDGNDSISEGGGVADTIQLVNLTPDDVVVRLAGRDLVLTIKETGETLTESFWGWAHVARYQPYEVESIHLADGSIWDRAGIFARTLVGTAASESIAGFDSNDRLTGEGGNDSLDGGAGDDTLEGGGASDVLQGGTGNDVLLGGESYDRLYGGDGDDTIDGGSQADELNGGAGSDTYVWGAGSGNDQMYDYSQAGDLNTIGLRGLVESDVTIGATTRIGGYGGYVLVTISQKGTGETLEISLGEEMLAGDTLGSTRILFADGTDWSADKVRSLGLIGTPEDDLIVGNVMNQALEGGDGNDTLDGGAGDDFLSGLSGDDVYLWGRGSGNDVVFEDWWGGGNDLVSVTNLNAADVRIVRSAENVTLTDRLTGATLTLPQAFSYYGVPIVERISFADGTVLEVATISEPVNHAPELIAAPPAQAAWAATPFFLVLPAGLFIDPDEGDGLALSASLTGGLPLPAWLAFDPLARQFSGTPGLQDNGVSEILITATDLQGAAASTIFSITVNAYNVMTGTTGKDTITGTGAMDHIDGLAGADRMVGGRNDDIYDVDNANDVVVELPGEGWDCVETVVTFTLPDQVEALTLLGAANLQGTGNAAANLLLGNAGNNRLDGLAGADTLVGGAGNDIYVTDDAGDEVIELAGEGTDTVLSSMNFTLGTEFENLTLTGITLLTGTGNDLDNVLRASAAGSLLFGVGGNDVLWGAGAVDTLVGDEGDDRLYGGAGDDSLSGGTGNDRLDGEGGADILDGGAGNDTYVVDSVGDQVVEQDNDWGGTDTVLSSVDFTLGANVERLTLTGTSPVVGTGNELANLLWTGSAGGVLRGLDGNDVLHGAGGADLLDGGAEDDKLYGGLGSDTLMGGDGVDRLDGEGGVDSLSGGAGDDIYVADDPGDEVIELLDEGTDTVLSSASFTLDANVENLTLTGAAAIDGTGNLLDNVITGNTADNALSGGDGNDTILGGSGDDILLGDAGNDSINGGIGIDTMTGGAGDDTFVVDSPFDLPIEADGEGLDTVLCSVSLISLSANVENLVLTGSGAINGTGNDLSNLLTGNAGANMLDGAMGDDSLLGGSGNDTLTGGDGNDSLDGGAGTDSMTGGAGDDTYVVGTALDTVVENVGEGMDTVRSSVTLALLSANVENLMLTGTGNISGTGNDDSNELTGNNGNNALSGLAGNDVLSGGAGLDTLNGGGGTDTLSGGLGSDTFVFDNLSAVDTVLDFNVSDDTIRLMRSVFTVLPKGTLAAAAFQIGAVAMDATDRVIYDDATGALWYDADGNGPGAAVQFAALVGVSGTLTNSDFVVV